MYIVSACLAGVNCKYNGKNNLNMEILKLLKSGKAMLVCPEQMGGLSTPRPPTEIVTDRNGDIRVINNKNIDLTSQFNKGAYETLKIAKQINANIAILKARSPSCGYGKIYDGSFSGKLKKGNGITADLLERNGIKIYNEENFKKIL